MAEKQEQDQGENEKSLKTSDPDQDEELSALLNSALDDFDKPPPSNAKDKTTEKAGSSISTTVDPTDDTFLDAQWTDEFIRQAASQFEQNVQALLSQGTNPLENVSPNELGANFQKMAEAAAKAMSDDTGTDGEFTSAISQTLKSLSEGAENLQTQFSDEDIANMLGGLGMGESSEGGEMFPFMQQMMQSLLSKEILYPALKDIVDKYPTWLEANKSNLEPSEFERFSKQKTLMDDVCAELENELETDTPEIKKRRFDKILDLMQKMQDCGQPPKDLVGDLGSVVTFDDQGNPQLPGFPTGTDPSQCCVM